MLERLLRKTTQWVCDRYEDSEFGLASSYASPREEIETLLGAPFEFVKLVPSRESALAVVLADLAYCFCPRLYPDIVNDIKAVKIAPSVVFPRDTLQAMFLNRGATCPLPNLDYPDEVSTRPLRHHQLQAGPRKLEVAGGVVLPLVVSTLLRDRPFSDCYTRVPSRPTSQQILEFDRRPSVSSREEP
jgi:hypothetical protein